jgi:hypothetical protein
MTWGWRMVKSLFFAAVLTLIGGMALDEHAISLEPEGGQAVAPEPAPSVSEAAPVVAAPEPTAPPVQSAPAQAASVQPQPVQKVEVTFPAEHDVYLVPAATREVCTTLELGFGDIQTDCRTQPIQVRGDDPALRGLCITRYGRRVCY